MPVCKLNGLQQFHSFRPHKHTSRSERNFVYVPAVTTVVFYSGASMVEERRWVGAEVVGVCRGNLHLRSPLNVPPPPPMPSHVPYGLMVPAPGSGRSVSDFRAWGAHRAQLRYLDDVSE
jgi:hypothetical protein